MSADQVAAKIDAGDSFAIRFLVPDGETLFTDMVHGEMRFGNEDIDDLVILRADGTPVYNMAVVSDDADAEITHVIRGDDHLSNTPKQVLLCRALGLPEPAFGHVPMILGSDGKRLSKRHGATAVGDYAAEGVLPEAMLNFLTLLGWSPGDDREFMDRAELVEAFTMERVLKASSVFDQDKLAWMNGRHLAAKPAAELVAAVREKLEEQGDLDSSRLADSDWMAGAVEVHITRSRTVDDLASQLTPFVVTSLDFDEKAVVKHWEKDPSAALQRLQAVLDLLESVDWEHQALDDGLRGLAESLGVGLGKVIHPLRVAVTGRMSSAGIFDVLMLLGRDRALSRVRAGIESVTALKKKVS
jgi:glutamyl-tRNA synthetase